LVSPYDCGFVPVNAILRIVAAQIDRQTFKYFFVVWLLAAFITPIPGLIGTFYIDGNLLSLPLWVGYFMLGVFLLNVKLQSRILLGLTALGLALTMVGTYIIAATVGGAHTYYFQDYFSPTMILASAALFLLLNTIKAPTNQIEKRQSKINWLIKQISQSTLAIFLFHVIVLETLQRGYLWGFTISGNNLNSIIEVPLITAVTFLICLGVILPLRKVPIIKKLIG
jgi:surface polysaccharide O-acyltransferase-like enzyme